MRFKIGIIESSLHLDVIYNYKGYIDSNTAIDYFNKNYIFYDTDSSFSNADIKELLRVVTSL